MSKDNGKLNAKQRAIKDGKTCATCYGRFPQHTQIPVAIPPARGQIQTPGQIMVVGLVVCGDVRSPLFQTVVTGQCSCSKWDGEAKPPEQPQAQRPKLIVPDKIANRMRNKR